MPDQVSTSKPKASSGFAQHELDKAEKQFDAFQENIKELNAQSKADAPKAEQSPQEVAKKANEVWLKPKRTVGAGYDPKTGFREKFNEKFRSDYEFKKEYVCFTAENREIIGEKIDIWTKPFPGMDTEEWEVPVNRPVWGPRYLAERIRGCSYRRFAMSEAPTQQAGVGTFYGKMVVQNTLQRLDAQPFTERKSVFMGAGGF